MGIGQEFHRITSLSGRIYGKRPDMSSYEPSDQRIGLPAVQQVPGLLDTAIRTRRSIRDYSDSPITALELAQILFAGAGQKDHGRTVPSAGALYPIDLYVAVNRVQGIDSAVYLYLSHAHALQVLVARPIAQDLAIACLGQDFLADAAVVVIMVAQFERTCRRYQDRGYRYIYMEAGHISQDIYLAASAMGLGSVAIGAFFDDQVNALLGLDGIGRAAIYIQAVGQPRH